MKSYVVLDHKTLLVEASDGFFEGKLVVVDVEAVIVVVVVMKAVYSDFLSSSEAAWEEPASEPEEGSLLDAHNEQGFLSSFLNLLAETPRIAIDLWLKRRKLNHASSLKCLLSRNKLAINTDVCVALIAVWHILRMNCASTAEHIS